MGIVAMDTVSRLLIRIAMPEWLDRALSVPDEGVAVQFGDGLAQFFLGVHHNRRACRAAQNIVEPTTVRYALAAAMPAGENPPC